MVFDVHGQMRFSLLPRKVSRNCPRHEYRSRVVHHFQPQVMVEPTRVVLMDYKRLSGGCGRGIDVSLDCGFRLGRLVERALVGVVFGVRFGGSRHFSSASARGRLLRRDPPTKYRRALQTQRRGGTSPPWLETPSTPPADRGK